MIASRSDDVTLIIYESLKLWMTDRAVIVAGANDKQDVVA